MEKIKVSVVVPVYNAAATLERCLYSLQSQLLKEIEIIIVNDGSTDESLAIMEAFSRNDSRIRILNQYNQGVSCARNEGIRSAKGKWITFCDADDIVDEDWLEVMYSHTKETDLVATGIQFITVDDQKINALPGKEIASGTSKNEIIDLLIINEIYGFLVTKLFKLEIIRNNNLLFDSSIHFREDELWVTLYIEHCNKWCSVPYIGYHYYLPGPGKKYKGSYTDFIIPIFEVYKRIFVNKLSEPISNEYYKMIRNQIVMKIGMGSPAEIALLEIFKRLVESHNYGKNFVSRIMDFLLIHSSLFPKVMKVILSLKK